MIGWTVGEQGDKGSYGRICKIVYTGSDPIYPRNDGTETERWTPRRLL